MGLWNSLGFHSLLSRKLNLVTEQSRKRTKTIAYLKTHLSKPQQYKIQVSKQKVDQQLWILEVGKWTLEPFKSSQIIRDLFKQSVKIIRALSKQSVQEMFNFTRFSSSIQEVLLWEQAL